MPNFDPSIAAAALPLACRGPVLRVLSAGPDERVELVAAPAGPLVVRIVRDARGLSGELAVLARLSSPRLARLVDGGTLPGGGAFLAREWVAGRDLAEGGARAAREAAGFVLEVLLGLVDLHRSGFAHGDLKPANLILREGGGVSLTDFGLARSGRGSRRSGGTVGFAAPEVLVGSEATPAADLFSLGVTWLALLGVPLPPPSKLYGRFPAESFLVAAGIDSDALPELHRDLISELLHRDPRARPSSAAEFARRLAARLDVELGGGAQAPLEAPYWPRAAGREAEYRAALERCTARQHVEVWRLPSAAEARVFAREVSLTEAVRGRAVQLVDLEAELARVGDSGGFDRWLAGLERRNATTTLVLAGSSEPWTQELARALAALHPLRGLVRCVGPEVPPAEGDVVIPPQSLAVTLTLLGRALPGEALERLEELAGVLAAETRGAAEEAAARVQVLFRAGHVVDAGDGARVAPGVDALAVLRASPRQDIRTLRALPEQQRRLLGALAALDGLSVEDTLAVAGDGCTEDDLSSLAHAGWCDIQRLRGQRHAFARLTVSLVELGLERAARRLIFARAAARIAADPASESAWSLRYLAEGAQVVPELITAARDGITRGAAQKVRAALIRLRERAAREAEPMPAELAVELAFALLQTDDVRAAKDELKALENQPRIQARVTRLRAFVARAERDHSRERELFLQAGDVPSAVRVDVHAALLAGDLDAVERLATAYITEPGAAAVLTNLDHEALAAHVDILSAAALGALRRGERTRVDFWNAAALHLAEHTEFASMRASVLFNVATVQRRLGELQVALPMYERAVAESKRLGRASSLARARLALAGVLRELGRVAEAEPLALEALGTRRRMGDRPGTALARGVHGLILADRGHLHAASVELSQAAIDLERTGQAEQAALMSARAAEVRARSGRELAVPEAIRSHSAREPRIEVALARAAACAGMKSLALEAVERARESAKNLGFKQVEREAQLILCALDPARAGADSAAGKSTSMDSLIGDDEVVLQWLGAETFSGGAAFEFARELVARGRDDRAARLAIAVAARDPDPVRRERASALARSALERVLAGAERATVETAPWFLTGLPDPHPADLERWQLQPEDEMDVLTVLGINERLVEQQDLDTLLRAIVDAALEVTGAERGFIVLEEHGRLSLDRALDSARGDLAADEVEFSSSIVRAALERGAPLRVADAGEDVEYSAARSVASFELRSVLCQPFAVEEGLRGVVLVDERRRPGAFGPREERLLGLLAGQAALALRQVRRLESITRLRDELAARVVERETRLEVAERRLEARGQVAPVEGLIGDTPPMHAVHKLLRRIAPSDLPVLVTGESGTGKEVAARALHALSSRVKGPFVAENCAALPATLLESELFGSRRGSYTGAERDREGLFERADGGTLFLDEIGELPLDQQAKLLRVLETREVRRIGDTETRSVDFRLVVATHRDLAQEVREGRFREDLMYRLDTVQVVMPPLRERLQDIPLLVEHFVRLAGAREGRVRRVAPEVMKALVARPWPGNVRELANEVARLLVLSDGDLADPTLVRGPAGPSEGAGFDLVRPLAELEREAILAALARTGGDKREAAELLGISRAKVYQRLKEWGLGGD